MELQLVLVVVSGDWRFARPAGVKAFEKLLHYHDRRN